MNEYDEYLVTFKDFYVELSKLRDVLSSADDIARAIEDGSKYSAESRRKGVEYLNSILVDAMAKCETVAAMLEERKDNDKN